MRGQWQVAAADAVGRMVGRIRHGAAGLGADWLRLGRRCPKDVIAKWLDNRTAAISITYDSNSYTSEEVKRFAAGLGRPDHRNPQHGKLIDQIAADGDVALVLLLHNESVYSFQIAE